MHTTMGVTIMVCCYNPRFCVSGKADQTLNPDYLPVGDLNWIAHDSKRFCITFIASALLDL